MKFLRTLLLPLLSILLASGNQVLSKINNPLLGVSSVVKHTAKTDGNAGVCTKQGRKYNVIDEKRLQHTFRNASGHLKDTPANRKLLERIANDPKCKLGPPDKYGKTWYGLTREDGKQVWASVRNGKIEGGGINQIPKSYHPDTGLCASNPPKQK